MIAAIALGFAALLTVAYFGYGRWVGRQLGLDDGRVTISTTSLVDLQRAAVEKALADCNGHRTRAAESEPHSARVLSGPTRGAFAVELPGRDATRVGTSESAADRSRR